MPQNIRIATRNSALALWQAQSVKSQLLQHYPELTITLIPMTTQGDQLLNYSLSKIGGKGLFVKELENALLSGEADIAVHSMKDVPMHLPVGLAITAIMRRGASEDAFVSRQFRSLAEMPPGSRVGTSSARRKIILQREYPHLKSVDVRGNVQTRLQKCERGEVEGLILAAAGLERLALFDHLCQRLPTATWLPAPGQGAIGVESRVDDDRLATYLQAINDQDTWDIVIAERSLSRVLNGSCGVPLAAYALLEQEEIFLRAWVASANNDYFEYAAARANRTQAARLGETVAHILLARGVQEWLTL